MSDVLSGELLSVETTVNQALAQITKAEIDQQIATAHAYPRSLANFKTRALEMVSLDEETAESCIYSRPVGKDKTTGKQTFAEGMSIRMAEIVGACFGNIRVGAIIVEMTPRYVKARGMGHDLESNFATTSEVIESTIDKYGNPYNERMRVVVAKAALSKARRDVTFSIVPRALCKFLEREARKIAVGDSEALDKRREKIMGWIKHLGIDAARVFAALNIAGIEDLGVEEITTLTGLRTAIKDGEVSIDEAFPPISKNGNLSAAAQTAMEKAEAREKARKEKTQSASTEQPSGLFDNAEQEQ